MRNGLKRIMAILIATLILLGALPASALETESSNVVVPGIDLFSIVDPDQTPVTTYVFYDGNEVVSTQSVKNGETLYEPQAQEKAGMVFEGWYTEQQGGERFNRFGEVTVEQGGTVRLYARYATAYYVYFYNPAGTKLMHTETVSDHAAHDFSGVTYDTGSSTTGVVGWAYEANGMQDVSKNVVVPENATSVNLYAIIETGYWVTFNTNGGSAVDPVFVRSGSLDVSQYEYVPTRAGYEFGGWQDENGKVVTVVNGVSSLTATWRPTTVRYTVIYWYENADDDGYSYVASASKNAQTGEVVHSEGHQYDNFDGKDTAHFTYNPDTNLEGTTATVAGDGSTILNVYFKRNEYTLTFREKEGWWNPQYSIVATITAKYDAEIFSEFNEAPFTTTYNGRAWEDAGNTYDYALQTLDRMPGTNVTFNLYQKSSNELKTIYYYVEKVGADAGNRWPNSNSDPERDNYELLKEVDTYFNYATYEEEYHEIAGFTRFSRTGAGFDRQNQKDFENRQLDLFYIRNSYDLQYYNVNGIAKTEEDIDYEASLAGYGNYVPGCPYDDSTMYEFAGWYMDPEGQTPYNFEQATMPAGDVIVYAKWVPRTFTVRFDLNYVGAQDAPVDQTVAAYAKAVEPEDPTRDGFQFTGWYRDSKCTEPFSFDTQITEDMTIYAGWYTSESYRVTYHANNVVEPDVPVKDPTVYDYDASAKIKGVGDVAFTAPTDRPYFLGWATSAGGAAVYQPGALLDISENEGLADGENTIHLYAVWGAQPGTTTLTYDANYEGADPRQMLHLIGGSSNLPNNTTLTLYGLEEAGFSRPGYEFLGWAEDPTATEAKYLAGAEVLVDNLGENFLYAVWKQSAVDVTIAKQVTGNMGDRTKAFAFTVSVPEGVSIGEPTGGEYTLTDSRTATFSLSHNKSVTLHDVPIGATLTITENDATGYTVSINGTPLGQGVYTGSYPVVADVENKVTVENNKEAIPDTGIVTDSLPYIVILACVVAIGAVVIVRRRGRRDE